MKTTIRIGIALLLGASSLRAAGDEPLPAGKFAVKIRDDKTDVVPVDDGAATDPTPRIRFQAQGNFYVNIMTMQNQNLHLSHFPQFMIDGRLVAPGQQGLAIARVAKPVAGKARNQINIPIGDNIDVTQTAELVPSKSRGPSQKRLMDTVLIRYEIHNKGTQAKQVGMRVLMDTFIIDNDGCLFAAPTIPGKILDGITLEGKTLPPYLQMLQRADLQNPGFVAHLTLDVGSRREKANKIILSTLGAAFGNWNMPAAPAMGDSAIGIYWETKPIKPGGKRELAYAYGAGVAVSDNAGRFQLSLAGSFQPGKIFTVTAAIADPGVGQSLALDLPAGMKRLEGAEIQPVVPLAEGQETSIVLWKARVLRPGDHTLRIRSSTGVTQTKIISVTP